MKKALNNILPKDIRKSLESKYVHSFLDSLTEAERTKSIIETICTCVHNWDDAFLINQCLERNIPVVILPEVKPITVKEEQ